MSEAVERARALEYLAAHGLSDGFDLPVLPGYVVSVNPDAVIAAMLAFAAEARSHDGEWEAIETAPKDGRDVLLFYPLEGLDHNLHPQRIIGW